MAVEAPEPDPEELNDEGPVINLQIGGHVTEDGVYVAFTRITGVAEPDEAGEPAPLAEIRLTFHESVAGPEVAAMFQVFTQNVDGIIERVDQVRAEQQEAQND